MGTASPLAYPNPKHWPYAGFRDVGPYGLEWSFSVRFRAQAGAYPCAQNHYALKPDEGLIMYDRARGRRKPV